MATSTDEWFAQLGLGVFLGPMPLSDLRQLAQSGALLESDNVRRAGAEEWEPASGVPGVFQSEAEEWLELPDESVLSQIAAEEAQALADETADESITLDVSASVVEQSVTVPVPATVAVKAAKPPLALRPAVVDRPIPPMPKPVTHDFEKAFPKEPVVEAPPVSAQPKAVPVPMPPALSVEAAPTEPKATPSTLSLDELEQLPVTSMRPPVVRSASMTGSSMDASWSSSSWMKPALLALTAVGVVMLAWWMWPSSESHIYSDYSRIYADLQQYRSGAGDAGRWSEFVKQAREATDKSVPWLESHAKPGDRNKDLLLYVGRDLQASLDVPPSDKFRHQQRLDGFMSQLKEAFGEP